MEKRKPHYELDDIKREFRSAETMRWSKTAENSGLSLGLKSQDVVDLIQEMTRDQFYKSMTSEADSTVWQDVYHVPCWDDENDKEVILYVKFTRTKLSYLLISLKEKE